MPQGTLERFMSKVVTNGDDDCWTWTASTGSNGYGQFKRPGTRGMGRAHRISYELFVGPIPDGFEIDHVCHSADTSCGPGECAHRLCVNPDHLEPVTRKVHRGRARYSSGSRKTKKTHCPAGHSYADHKLPSGGCRLCNRARKARYWEKNRERVNAKQRAKRQGPGHYSKLTVDDVREVRRLLAEGQLSQSQIGARFGIAQGTVGAIKLGRSWKGIGL